MTSSQAMQSSTMIGVNSRIKYFPWADWTEWRNLHSQIQQVLPNFVSSGKATSGKDFRKSSQMEAQLLGQALDQCLRRLRLWLAKNSSVISSAQNASPHSKYLKMQKIILEEFKSRLTEADS